MAKLPEIVRRRKAYRPAIIARQDWVKNTDDSSDWKVGTIDYDNGYSEVTVTFSINTDNLSDKLTELGCRHIVRWRERDSK
jgi:hypothetical protein